MKKSLILFLSVLFIAGVFGCEDTGPATGGCSDGDCSNLVEYPNILAPKENGPVTGPYKDIVIEGDPDFPTHTIIRPRNIDKKMPILSWGEGGCVKMGRSYAEMMGEVASYGIIVIADGGPKMNDMWGGESGAISPGGVINQTGEALSMGIDYAFDKNDNDPCSPLYQKVDKTKVAVSGQSCGGLLALGAAGDPRVTVTFIMSSGIFTKVQREQILPKLHTPVIYLNGGSTDIAYAQAEADVAWISANMDIPLYWVNSGIGHMADILTDNGGTFGTCLKDWMVYQFFGDTPENFEGDDCLYCQDDDRETVPFTVEKFNGAK